MSRVYTAQDALEIILNGGESDFESSDDEEITELAIDEEEVPEHNIDDYFSSSDDEPLSTYRTNRRPYQWEDGAFIPPDAAFVPDPMEPPAREMTPYMYYKLFITDDMMDKAAYHTNLYSVQKNGVSIKTTKLELEQLTGMYLRMGLVQMPNVRCYWEEDCRYPAVADVMSRTRFESLMTSVHFVDNTTPTEAEKKADKYWKLRPWTEDLRKNCLKVTPEEYQSVDEIMVAFKGKSLLRQFLPAKPHKWGFKLWGRCGVSGFMYDFGLYQGKGPTERNVGCPGSCTTLVCIRARNQVNEMWGVRVHVRLWFVSGQGTNWTKCGVSGFMYDFGLYQGKEPSERNVGCPGSCTTLVCIRARNQVNEMRGVRVHVRLWFVSGQGTNWTNCVRVWNEWGRCPETGVNVSTKSQLQDQCRQLLHKHSTCWETQRGWISVHRHNPSKSLKRLPAFVRKRAEEEWPGFSWSSPNKERKHHSGTLVWQPSGELGVILCRTWTSRHGETLRQKDARLHWSPQAKHRQDLQHVHGRCWQARHVVRPVQTNCQIATLVLVHLAAHNHHGRLQCMVTISQAPEGAPWYFQNHAA